METTSATRKLRKRPRPAARCKGGKAEPATLRTAGTVTDGFLRHSFMPMYQPAPELPEEEATAGDFFKSLAYLTAHYAIGLPDYRSLPYPYNILMAEKELNRRLKTKGRHRELMIVQQENEQTCLTVKETFSHYFGLYYIPVMPIYELCQNPEHLPCAGLLTAVCAYLQAEAGITYYRDEDNYMFYNYEILADWIEDGRGDADGEDYSQEKTALDNAQLQGDFIQEKMKATGFCQSLGSLISSFKAVTEFEQNCLKLAQACLELWQAFPKGNLYHHANLQDYEVEEYEDNYVGMQEYIAFIGSANDVIGEGLLDMVNNDFNERSRFQEPETVTLFNEPKAVYTDELAYEKRVFQLIGELCTLLHRKP